MREKFRAADAAADAENHSAGPPESHASDVATTPTPAPAPTPSPTPAPTPFQPPCAEASSTATPGGKAGSHKCNKANSQLQDGTVRSNLHEPVPVGTVVSREFLAMMACQYGGLHSEQY